MLKVAIMLLSPPKYLFSIEIEIYPTVIVFLFFFGRIEYTKRHFEINWPLLHRGAALQILAGVLIH